MIRSIIEVIGVGVGELAKVVVFVEYVKCCFFFLIVEVINYMVRLIEFSEIKFWVVMVFLNSSCL